MSSRAVPVVVVAVVLLPAASATCSAMTCVPTPTLRSAGGSWLMGSCSSGVQLSEACAPPTASGRVARHIASACTTVGGGGTSTGARGYSRHRRLGAHATGNQL